MTLTYFDRDKNRLPLSHYQFPPAKEDIHLTGKIDEMMALAEKLSSGQSFARFDFYLVNNQIYFGEITKFPDSGFGTFKGQETE